MSSSSLPSPDALVPEQGGGASQVSSTGPVSTYRTQGYHFPTTCWTLIREARAGSPEAERDFMGKYYAPLQAYARRAGLSPDDGHDFAVDLLQSILRNQSLEGKEKGIRVWLKWLAKNRIIDFHRRQSRQEARQGDLPEDTSAEELLKDPSRTPDEVLDLVFLRQLIDATKQEVRNTGHPEVDVWEFYALNRQDKDITPEQWESMAAQVGKSVVATKRGLQRLREALAEKFIQLVREGFPEDMPDSDQALDEELNLTRTFWSKHLTPP